MQASNGGILDSTEPSQQEWRDKFDRETKVNKELGRRLRDLKQQLVEEKLMSQQLREQLEELEGQPQTDSNGKPAEPCADCKKMQIEIAKLHADLAALRGESNQEVAKAPAEIISDGSAETEPASDTEMPNVHDGSDDEPEDVHTEAEDAPVGSDVQPPRVPELHAPLRRHSIALQLSAVDLNSRDPEQQPAPEANNQVYHEQSFQSFLDCNETSLDSLFKYAIVLAGPPPAKPKRNIFASLSDRFRAAEFRRTRSLPDTQQLRSEQQTSELPQLSTETPTPSKAKQQSASSGGASSWLAWRPQSPAGLDLVTEESAPSPQKGWFSNLMTNGLRGNVTSPRSPTSDISSAAMSSPGRCSMPETPIDANRTSPASKMISVYPPDCSEVSELEGLVEICFPYGEKPPLARDFGISDLRRTLQERHRTYRNADSTFVLTIASAANPTEITYAICVRCPLFPDDDASGSEDKTGARSSYDSQTLLPSQCCLCLLTPYPFFNLFFKVLYGIAVLWDVKRREHLAKALASSAEGDIEGPKQLGMKDFVDHFQGIMARLREMQFPAMGGWSRMMLSPGITALSFHRPHSKNTIEERHSLLLEYAAPTLFGLLPMDQVLFLLGCLCCERTVLLVSDHVNAVSACVLALITLLSPMQWAGPVITVLPPRLEELLEAPVPLIAGRVSTSSATLPKFSTLREPMRGVIEMNMDQNQLCMHEDDMVVYHEVKLPDCDALVHELGQPASLLFQKHTEPDFPTAQQAEACEFICTRIRQYISAICAMALAADESPATGTSIHELAINAQLNSAMKAIPNRRSSDISLAFVEQLRQTQMFSVFKLHQQDLRADGAEEDDDAVDDDDDDDDDDIEDRREADTDTNVEDLAEAMGHSGTVEQVSQPAHLCCGSST